MSSTSKRIRGACVAAAAAACLSGAHAPPAVAFNPLKPLCTVGGLVSGLVGKACTVVEHGGRLVTAGTQLATGHLGGAVKTVLGDAGSSIGPRAMVVAGLAAIVASIVGGARYALDATAAIIGRTTTPQLRTTWFSGTYWRVAGIAAVLTLPFLFAAAIQAIVQSDLALLVRAALGYLPLAMVGVAIAAPLTTLLLAASDQMSAVVSSAAGHAGARFLGHAGAAVGLLTVVSRSPFLALVVGTLTVGGAVALWCELLVRTAAVYVIVLMLPLVFAALVWPARRIWAIRAVEVLVALILSKFVIVAVLSLGGAALGSSFLPSVGAMIAGFVLLAMATLSPWALLRLLPLGELASGAVANWRGELRGARSRVSDARSRAMAAHEWATTTAEMRRDADDVAAANGHDPAPSIPAERTDAVEALVGGAAVRAAGDAGRAPGPRRDHAEPTARPASESSDGSVERTALRAPRLGSIWQAADDSWPALTLGLEDGWPPKPLDEEVGIGTNSVAGEPQLEDHDPTPPAQPSKGGPL